MCGLYVDGWCRGGGRGGGEGEYRKSDSLWSLDL